ncbi:MAG: HU family DNA-binding protein [Thermomicrobiales bacterium]|nr:HU family DNA-binding protein [Thermomicrobiales bacterium]
MRKQDLIRAVARETSKPESQIAPVVNAVFDTIQRTLADGDEVAISGFGTFRVVERPAREGRNPQSGLPMMIGPGKSPAFRPGAALKRAVGDDGDS